jgi:hypothetical protein
MAKQRPIYTKAQHQIVTPSFVEKKIQLHKKISWTTKDGRDLFLMVSGSVTRYVPKSEHNSQAPMGFCNLQMGHLNKISIHTRDFDQLADVFLQVHVFMKKKAAKLDQVVNKELDTYTTHHLKNLLDTNEQP